MRKPNLLLLVGVAVVCWAGEALAAREEGPELPLRESVSQYGITWTFDKEVPVGQFVNGDYYVVGPVTIVSITPKPENGRNGSVLNLPPNPGKSGFDSRVASPHSSYYDPNLRANLPIRAKPGDSLISTTSVEKVGVIRRMLSSSEKTGSPVKTAAVLTCLAEQAPPDAFRPSYCDISNKIYLARNLRKDRLPSLPRVESTPSVEKWERVFQRPWIDVCFFGFDAPVENMPDYGFQLGQAAGFASLLLCCDFKQEEKEKLLINFVQVGIDHWGIVRAGYGGWPAHGGHGSGRKWAIMFAGIMLGDEEMASPTKTYPNLKFGEDMQTMYGEGWTGAKALYAGHTGRDGYKGGKGWGPYEHLHPSEWPSMIGERYRRCCTSVCWVGQALAARILHAQKAWNHDAFFDYVDRWMTEDDTEAIKIIKEATGHDFSAGWARQGQAWDEFVNKMWARYRDDLPPAQDPLQKEE